MSLLFDALDERFDDLEECKEISEHGCASCAPHGFIYYYETKAFFEEHQDEIEQYIDDNYGWKLFMEEEGRYSLSVRELINTLVWWTVESYCQSKSLIEDEEEAWKDSNCVMSPCHY